VERVQAPDRLRGVSGDHIADPPGASYFLDRTDHDRLRRHAIDQLQRLGYAVTIEATPA
jgi:hypothetical protein